MAREPTGGRPMKGIQAERLLETCVARGAKEIRLVVGRPVLLVVGEEVCEMRTKVVSAADVAAVMERIGPTPDEMACGLVDPDDFEIEYVDVCGYEARFRVRLLREDGQRFVVLRRTSGPSREAELVVRVKLGEPSMN